MTKDPARPLDALNTMRGKRVIVERKQSSAMEGKLQAFDIHVNTVLDDVKDQGTVFIRGDQVVTIREA